MNFISIEALADLDDMRLPIPIRRNLAADLVTALIAIIDDIDGDENLEPSLGFEPLTGTYDLEADCDEDDDTEREPSLGWTEMEARYGCRPVFDADLEHDDADDEPSLGSPEISPMTMFDLKNGRGWGWRQGTQETSWAKGSRDDGEEDGGDAPEQVNEDGGDIQDEPHDEEPDLEYSAGVDCADANVTEWSERHPEQTVDWGPFLPSVRQSRRRDLRSAGVGNQGRFHGMILNTMPPSYVTRVEGDCLVPEIPANARLEFSSVERPGPGDFVLIYRYAQFVRPGEWQSLVKRLVLDCRQGDLRIPGVPGDGRGLLVEMLNPPRRFFVPGEQVEAMHKMVRVVPDDEHHPQVSAAELAGDALASGDRA